MLDDLESLLEKIQSYCGKKINMEDFGELSSLLITFANGWNDLLKEIVVDEQSIPTNDEIKDKLCSQPADIELVSDNPADLEKLKVNSTGNLLIGCLITCTLAKESNKKIDKEKQESAKFIKMYLIDAAEHAQKILKDDKMCKMAWIKWNSLAELCRDLHYRDMFANGFKMSKQSIISDLEVIRGLHQQMVKQSGGTRKKKLAEV